MKIGIYIDNGIPESGGAFSFLKTIESEIKKSHDSKEYLFIYIGEPKKNYSKVIDGVKYINRDFFDGLYKKSLFQRILRKIGIKLRLVKKTASIWNRIAKKEKIDLFWFPQPVDCEIDYPYVYTVWDIGHRMVPYFPEVSGDWNDRESAHIKMLFKASYIITGNETGKKEILMNYPMNPDKIRIIPFPISLFCYGVEKKPDFNLPNDYLFYPAQFWPHKNHICILNALNIIRDKYRIIKNVIFTGSDKGTKSYIIDQAKKLNIDKQVFFVGFLSSEELKYIYTHADAMIFASLMGPNNMPPIEATYLGCPVIITDLAGHKEQLGESALYFNGYAPEELAEKIVMFSNSKELQSKLAKKQKKLSLEFEKMQYFSEIKKIFSEFEKIRQTWGKDYVGL